MIARGIARADVRMIPSRRHPSYRINEDRNGLALSDRIMLTRTGLGLSQPGLARKAGVHVSIIGKLEANNVKGGGSARIIGLLASALAVDMRWLWTGDLESTDDERDQSMTTDYLERVETAEREVLVRERSLVAAVEILAGHLEDWHNEEHAGAWLGCHYKECIETRALVDERIAIAAPAGRQDEGDVSALMRRAGDDLVREIDDGLQSLGEPLPPAGGTGGER